MRITSRGRLGLVVAGAAGTALAAGLVPALTTPASAAPPAGCPVVKPLDRADQYWIAHGPDQAANTWQNATFNTGNLAYVGLTGVANHYSLPWAQANKFKIATVPGQPAAPDPLASGEVYLILSALHGNNPSYIAGLRSRIKRDVKLVQGGKVTLWDHVEAINAAMPSFAKIGVQDKSPATLAAMHTLFTQVETRTGGHGLYDARTGLWWRDTTAAGTGTYWSPGNGYAFAGLAKVLQVLPANDARRAEYVRVFTAMAAALKQRQRDDGFWNVDLGDSPAFAGPESTGTALFAYGLAWGVNAAVLDKAAYSPVAAKAWNALVATALHADGKLGYVQSGTVTKPSGPAGPEDTGAHGVGAFLLAGPQVAKITPGC